MGIVLSVNDQNFKKEIEGSVLPVLVDFWAEWCNPCRMLAPVVEKIAVGYKNKLKVLKLSVEENQATASQFNVMSIPCLIIFKNGKEAGRLVGYMDEIRLGEQIDKILNDKRN